MNTFKVVVGDECDDGYGKYETIFVESSINTAEVEAAISSSIKEFGDVDITSLCTDYGDNTVPASVIDRAEELGIDLKGVVGEYNGKFYIEGPWGFVNLYLTLAAHFKPFEWTITSDDLQELCLPSSGYGLFE